jgi:hypothetical protein
MVEQGNRASHSKASLNHAYIDMNLSFKCLHSWTDHSDHFSGISRQAQGGWIPESLLNKNNLQKLAELMLDGACELTDEMN